MKDDVSHMIAQTVAVQGGQLGTLQLNRPDALNALTQEMLAQLMHHLTQWEADPNVVAIIVTSSVERAFCVGGDVVYLYQVARQQPEFAPHYFRLEYRLDEFISRLTTPYLVWLDGMTMGGGVGISVYSSHRVVTENMVWAMPETAIGFVTDIGATHFLNHAPGYTGTYLGLTGERLNAGDVLYAGFADYFIPTDRWDTVWDGLLHADWHRDAAHVLHRVLSEQAESAPTGPLAKKRDWIDRCFNRDRVKDVLDALAQEKNPACEKVRTQLMQKSPLSLAVTLEALRRGAGLTLRECLTMEYGIVQRLLDYPDFYAGVEAYLIKKHRQPKWSVDDVAKISATDIATFFDSEAVLFD